MQLLSYLLSALSLLIQLELLPHGTFSNTLCCGLSSYSEPFFLSLYLTTSMSSPVFANHELLCWMSIMATSFSSFTEPNLMRMELLFFGLVWNLVSISFSAPDHIYDLRLAFLRHALLAQGSVYGRFLEIWDQMKKLRA